MDGMASQRCRLINIVGFAGIGKTSLVRGGIGKTDLSLQFARKVRGEFEYIIWRGLLNAPPLKILLTELIEFVSDNRETELATTTDGLITQLLHYLKQRRCLVILNNVESILQTGEPARCGGSLHCSDWRGRDRAETYRSGYEEYGDFWQRIGSSEHQSCVLLTSRVKPRDIEDLEEVSLVRSLSICCFSFSLIKYLLSRLLFVIISVRYIDKVDLKVRHITLYLLISISQKIRSRSDISGSFILLI